MFDVQRLERMVLAAATPAPSATTSVAPKNAARHLRPASEFALTLPFNTPTN
jgi:hypothetical protein